MSPTCIGRRFHRRVVRIEAKHDLADRKIRGQGQLAVAARGVDHDRVRRPQVLDVPLDHLWRPADERRVVDADHVAGLALAARELRREQSLVERDRPRHAAHGTDAIDLGVAEGLLVIDVQLVRVDDPEIRLAGVANEPDGPAHQPDEDRALLRDEERGEGQP
jgi:hypothetical protein